MTFFVTLILDIQGQILKITISDEPLKILLQNVAKQ